jgi:hypothetical protein
VRARARLLLLFFVRLRLIERVDIKFVRENLERNKKTFDSFVLFLMRVMSQIFMCRQLSRAHNTTTKW